MFCKQDSTLHTKLHEAWKRYIAADEATLKEYGHLFPAKHNSNLPFVTFQQAVFREKVATATEEELNVIEEFIDKRFKEDTDRRERPWKVLKVDNTQSDVDLERRYINE